MWVLHFKRCILQVSLCLQDSVYGKMLQVDSKFFAFPYFWSALNHLHGNISIALKKFKLKSFRREIVLRDSQNPQLWYILYDKILASINLNIILLSVLDDWRSTYSLPKFSALFWHIIFAYTFFGRSHPLQTDTGANRSLEGYAPFFSRRRIFQEV